MDKYRYSILCISWSKYALKKCEYHVSSCDFYLCMGQEFMLNHVTKFAFPHKT